jgi:hypothetical protein
MGLRRARHRAHAILATILSCAALPIAAHAAPSVRLYATLTPERLGHGTTIGFGFQITTPAGDVPPPLLKVEVRYPNDLGIGLSGLGFATCTTRTLQALGPEGCPADSHMGYGSALAEIPIGTQIIHENAPVALLRGTTHDGHYTLLTFVNAEIPVFAPTTLPSLLLPAPTPFGGALDINVPLIPTFPDAPDVALTQLHTTIGPQHLTYYEHLHGHQKAYHPRGILLPPTCPRGGFPFAVSLTFASDEHASASTTVPCPAQRQGLHQGSWARDRSAVKQARSTPRAPISPWQLELCSSPSTPAPTSPLSPPAPSGRAACASSAPTR